MGQIQKGVTYTTGMVVSADNLNAHVDGAILLPGAITEQAAATAALTDLLLVSKSGSLKKVTAQSAIALQAVKAFVMFSYNFDANTVTILNSSNVSSVVPSTSGTNPTGKFRINFTTPFTNANYVMNSGGAGRVIGGTAPAILVGKPPEYPWNDTVNATDIYCYGSYPSVVWATFIGN